MFYPEAEPSRCTVAVLLEVDPVGLVRGRRGVAGEGGQLEYVNDRPYAVKSFMSVALGRLFATALGGKSATTLGNCVSYPSSGFSLIRFVENILVLRIP